MSNFVDIHTHHTSPDENNVISVGNIRLGIDFPTAEAPLYSAGIHPWDVNSVSDCESTISQLNHINCAAIGEIGLDKCTSSPWDKQIEIFERQLAIAQDRQLPVIIHCVRAWSEVCSILSRHTLRAVIFHGFRGSLQQAQALVELGYYISFGPKSFATPKHIEAFRWCPLDRIFFESDDAAMAITTVYETAATIKSIEIEKLKDIIEANFKQLFQI